ncbi:unnamed protein product [Mesocestoides corti]|uniref:HCO3_cotransp domain-containing protein n=1 Tax=Mesocestoides corti TaxID=53468 RepID=A0A0R3UQW6_MESCO|nr:unnamed protein product [Mesocestoides corti]
MGSGYAFDEQRKTVSAWNPQTDVWALAHGTKISALCVAGSSFSILMRMRQFFSLFSQQHLLGTILPVVVLPSMGYIIANDIFIERPFVTRLSRPNIGQHFCSTCLEVRGSFIQATAGVFAPFLLSVFSCAAASISYRTFPVPDLGDFRKVLSLVRRAGGSLSSTLILLTLANAFVGGFITLRMADQSALIRTTLRTSHLSE